MSEFGFDLEEVRRLIRLVEESGLSELELEEEGRLLVIHGAGALGAPSHDSAEPPAEPAHIDRSRLVTIESPMVGVFYRSGSPDSAPLVEVGDRIEVGQTIGMIEAMKVFSEIPAEHAGVVAEIVAQNGALVRQGEALMYLKPE